MNGKRYLVRKCVWFVEMTVVEAIAREKGGVAKVLRCLLKVGRLPSEKWSLFSECDFESSKSHKKKNGPAGAAGEQ